MRLRPPRRPDAPLAALRRRPELAALRRAVERTGIEAWIVGGAVRDAALGLAVPEVDVAVGRDAERLARDLEAAGFGRAVFLSRDRPGPRVFRVAGRRPIDLAELEGGSIEADLARRDFTVNAVAVSLGAPPSVLDPFGGLEDLKRSRLSCVSRRNMLDDPLRGLRAARFIATHRLRPDAEALAAARLAAPGLRGVAPERVATELSKLLESDEAAPALAWAARARILGPALGLALSEARLASAARALTALDGGAVRRLPPERRRRLRFAFLASRLRLSPASIRQWLNRRRFGRQEAGEVARLAALAETARSVSTREEAWRWALEAGAVGADAALLLASLRPAEARRARRLSLLARRPPRAVRVTGADLMRWLGIGPGPEVGRLLGELRVAAAMGRVQNRSEARHWLTGQVRRRL